MTRPKTLPSVSSPAIPSDYADTREYVRKAARLVYTSGDVDLCQFSANHGRFIVRYGVQIWYGLEYADAARIFGECLFHAMACEGKING